MWQDVLDRIQRSLMCLSHAIIQAKVVPHLHWSKVRLAKLTPSVDPMCDRYKIEPATLSHMFWSCFGKYRL